MDKKVLVIGDLMIDHYLWGACERISPEAPVQVVDIKKETTVLGGAGNVVNNLRALELDVTVMSVIGDDSNTDELISMIETLDIDRYLIIDENRKTTKKTRVIASHQQVMRYDNESKEDISYECEINLVMKLMEIIHTFEIVILSDYGKGVLTNSLISKIMFISQGANVKVLVDPKGKDFTKYRGAFLLTPNKSEAGLATGIEIKTDEDIKKTLLQLQFETSIILPMITLGEDGIVILKDNNLIKKPTVAREVFDVTGAGDTVISALAYGLIHNYSNEKMIEFANIAAGIVVGKLGNATVSLDEILEYKSTLHQSPIESHIKTLNQITQIVQNAKEKKKKIVFTNGCFDILHRGHVSYLSEAKSFGDILIVGLNSDSSVKQIKGETRPINLQDDRAYLLAALESVDYVVLFEEDTPIELIKTIKPDVLVKGADYQDKIVVGSDIAKEVKLVEFIDGKSTTKTIEKIKQSKGEISC